jgi:hypothetical protein
MLQIRGAGIGKEKGTEEVLKEWRRDKRKRVNKKTGIKREDKTVQAKSPATLLEHFASCTVSLLGKCRSTAVQLLLSGRLTTFPRPQTAKIMLCDDQLTETLEGKKTTGS